MKSATRIAGAAALAITFLTLGGAGRPAAAAEQTLYERLGGQQGITAVVDDFVGKVTADARINKHFVHADPARVKALLVDFVCRGTGGQCAYSGRDIKSGHAGRNISEAEFGALVENLALSLDKFQVPARDKHDLLALLESMQGAVVSH